MPVAPVVVWVIAADKAVLIQSVGMLDGPEEVFQPWPQQHLSDRKCIPNPIYIVYVVLVKCY